MFFGIISAKKRMPSVIPPAKISKLLPPSPKAFSASPPTNVAPRVFAMVLRLRMEDIVSSISSRYLSSSLPFREDFFFKDSISTGVMLKIIASKVEQRAEIPIVRAIATISSGSKFILEEIFARLDRRSPFPDCFRLCYSPFKCSNWNGWDALWMECPAG